MGRVWCVCNFIRRFAYSTPLDWPTAVVYSKMNSTRGALQRRSRTTSTPSLRFSSSPMVPCHASPSVLTIHSLPYPICSQNPWPATPPSCSPMSQALFILTSPGIPFPMFSETLHYSSSTTPSPSKSSIVDSDMTHI